MWVEKNCQIKCVTRKISSIKSLELAKKWIGSENLTLLQSPCLSLVIRLMKGRVFSFGNTQSDKMHKILTLVVQFLALIMGF